MLFALLLACKPDCVAGFHRQGNACYEDVVDEEPVCTDGFELRYGICYETADAEEPGALLQAAWPECSRDEGDGDLDLDAGCAAGICVDMTYTEAVDGAGEEAECRVDGGGWTFCSWSVGLGAWFIDMNEDTTPDADYRLTRVIVNLDYSGTTVDGLGVNQSLACWTETLGQPDTMTIDGPDGAWGVQYLEWDVPNIRVWDFLDADYNDGHDGNADYLYLYGPG